MVTLNQFVQKVKKAETAGAKALSNLIGRGIKDLPNLIKSLDKLNQSHLEFELLGWVMVFDKMD